jgi:hypothetical protein
LKNSENPEKVPSVNSEVLAELKNSENPEKVPSVNTIVCLPPQATPAIGGLGL